MWQIAPPAEINVFQYDIKVDHPTFSEILIFQSVRSSVFFMFKAKHDGRLYQCNKRFSDCIREVNLNKSKSGALVLESIVEDYSDDEVS